MADEFPPGPLTGVVVTGAASGIGLASARRLAAVGRPVALWDVNASLLDRRVQEIAESGATAIGCVVDLADPGAIAEAARATRQGLPSIGGLVHAAGLSGAETIEELSIDVWDRVHRVHVLALALMAKEFLPDLRRERGSAIVAISSLTALMGHRRTPAYGAAKGGVLSLVRSLADEGARDGIRANCISPGFIRTPMIEGFASQLSPEWLEQRVLLGRIGEPEEVASAVRFLMSDEASFITAHNLVIDGGQLHAER